MIEQCWSQANKEWPPLRPNVTPVKMVSSPSGSRDHARSLGSSTTHILVRQPVPANFDTTDTTDDKCDDKRDDNCDDKRDDNRGDKRDDKRGD